MAVRRVKRANSIALILENASGAESEMRIAAASLVEYDGEYLTIYEAGERALNELEQRIMNRVAEIRKQHENTYSGGYWQVKKFLLDSACPWLAGDEIRSGKKYLMDKNKVSDRATKGDAILKYKVYWV